MVSQRISPSYISEFNKNEMAMLKNSSSIQMAYNLQNSYHLDIQTPYTFEDNLKGVEAANSCSKCNLQSTGGTNPGFIPSSYSNYSSHRIEKNILDQSQELEGGMEVENEGIQHSAFDDSKSVQSNLDASIISNLPEQGPVVRERPEIQEEMKVENGPIQNTTFCGSNGGKNKPKPFVLKNLPKHIFVGVRKGCWNYWGRVGGIYLSCISRRLQELNFQQDEGLRRFLDDCDKPSTTWAGLRAYIATYTKDPKDYEVVGLFQEMLIDLVFNDQDFHTWIEASRMDPETKRKTRENRQRLIDEIRNQVH